MDFALLPTVSLRSRSFNALTAPREMFIQALNRNLNLQRFKVLYVTGNSSTILSRLDRRFEALEIRRGFTVFQLMTILERRLEESGPEEREEGRWPATFCLGE